MILILAGILSAPARAAPAPPVALGPERAWVVALAISPNFSSDGRAWLAAYGGRVYASSDGISSWHESFAGITDPVVTDLAVSPAFAVDNVVFATADDGVFKSTDAGQSWGKVSAQLDGHQPRLVALSPNFAQDHLVLVSTEAGIFRSVDGGASWQPGVGSPALATALLSIPGPFGTVLDLCRPGRWRIGEIARRWTDLGAGK